MSNVHSFHPCELLEMQRKTKGLNKAGKSESWFRLLATKLIKDCLNFQCVNEKQKLFSEHILPDIYAWLQPFEVDRAEIILSCMNYAPQHNRETTRNMTHHTKESWKLKALALCIFWKASIPELGERPMVRGYFNWERCSHKAYSVNYFNYGTDSLICVLVALTHRLPSPRT